MRQFITLFKKDLTELWRTKKVLILAIVFVIFALSSPLIAEMTPALLESLGDAVQITMPDPTINDSYDQFVKNIGQLGVFTMIIVFGGLIANEKKRGLYTTLRNNGVNKFNFIFSKIVSQLLVLTVIYGISVLIFSLYNSIIFDQLFVEYSWLSFLAFYVYLVFVICLTNFFSAISKNSLVAILLAIGVVISLAILDLFEFGKYAPNYLMSISLGILGDNSFLDYAWKNILITSALSTILIAISVKTLNNKES